VTEAYDKYEFFRASQAITNFCITDVSNFYFEVSKDRLYISANDDKRRRACQTVLKEVLDVLMAAIAPILPHMAEDAWQNLPYKAHTKSVFQAGWPTAAWPAYQSDAWALVRSVRDDVNAAMEKARVDKVVGANLDAEVFIHVPDAAKKKILAGLLHDGSMLAHPRPATFNGVDDVRFLFLVSGVTLVDTPDEVHTHIHTLTHLHTHTHTQTHTHTPDEVTGIRLDEAIRVGLRYATRFLFSLFLVSDETLV
jgi:isoleucyl-tRNA synthetase